MNQEENTTWLKKEVEEWKTHGIIDKYQAQKILSLYGLVEVPPEPRKVEKENKSSRLITVFSVLGALLVGIGVILFVASNWSGIPDFLKLILLFGTTFVMYFAGWKLKFDTKSHPKVGNALLFLASILVGATIFLTAQIFHVNANDHWLVLLWFLAISPFAYAFDSKPILWLSIFTFSLWLYMNISNIGLGMFEMIVLYLLFGISLYGVGQLHSIIEKYSRFQIVYQCVGLPFILGMFFFLSLEGTWRGIFSTTSKITSADWTVQLLFVLFFIISLVSVIAITAKSDKFKTLKYEFYVLLLAFLGALGTLLLTFFKEALTTTTTTIYSDTYTTLDPTADAILFIIYNLILFALIFSSIIIGQIKSQQSFFYLGAGFLLLEILHLLIVTSNLFLAFLALLLGGAALYSKFPIQELKYRFRGIEFSTMGLFILLFSSFYFCLSLKSIISETIIFEGISAVSFFMLSFIFIGMGLYNIYSLLRTNWEDKFAMYQITIAFFGWLIICSIIILGFPEPPNLLNTVFPMISYLILFSLSLLSILRGYYIGIRAPINIGMLFFALGVLHLYFTVVFGILPSSIAFIIGGLILLGGGWYLEKTRRSLIKNMGIHKNE